MVVSSTSAESSRTKPAARSIPRPGRAGSATPAAKVLRAWLILACAFARIVSAQPAVTNAPPSPQPGVTNASPVPSQDPMMTLMLSQPKLDTKSPVVAEASFDPPVVRPGERTIYRLTLNALRDAISWNGQLPATRLEIRAGAVGQTMQMAGTNFQPRTSFNFHARASTSGRYTVPSFVINVNGRSVRVPEASFHAANVQTSSPPQMLYVEVVPDRPFVGEATRVRVLAPSASGVVQALGQVQLVGTGFVHELTATRQTVETLPFGGRMVPAYVYETLMTPISPGKETIHAQAFAVGNRFSGSIVITGPAVLSGSMLHYTLLDSDPVRLEFRPLPAEGRLPGFSGAVGVYSFDPPQLSTNVVQPGEPLRMTVSIRGRGNLGRLALPVPPALPDWQILPPRRENLPLQVLEARGFVSFTYTLVPLRGELEATPELPFSFFHPDQEMYVSRNVPSVPVTVLAGKLPADLEDLLKQRMETDAREPVLSDITLARGGTVSALVPFQLRGWFPVVQLMPAMLFLGLWQWDRRRRYLEAHPDVVVRRRARKELRRERRRMRGAAQRGNAAAYQQAAIRALQVASAPNFPAEPDAMISTDVLRFFDDAAPAGTRAAVERLFANSNAERFAGRRAGGVIEEREQIERAVRALEEKL